MSKCCFCIPLEIGVKLIAALTILGTVGTAYTCYTDKLYAETFSPIFWSALLMSIIWIFTLAHDTPATRKLAAWGSLVLRVLVHFFCYGYGIFITGNAQGCFCTEERITLINEKNDAEH